ncbi:MAG: molybdopterin-dependent oxidoreductase [Christensenellales bacterium]|jgi:type II secretory pathway pseudopilin PulG
MENNKKGSGKTWIIVAIIIVLVAASAVFAVLNSGNAQEKQQSQENATVTVTKGDQQKTFDLAYLKALNKQEFSAIVDTSKTDPTEKSFGGVPLKTVLYDLGFDIADAGQIVFSAVDGYTSVVTAEEALAEENIYLVYERNKKPSGTRQQGGSGPIEIVIRGDAFAQRWCKFLMDITIE